MVNVRLLPYRDQDPETMVQEAQDAADDMQVVGFEVSPDEFYVVLRASVAVHGHSTEETIRCVLGRVWARNSLYPHTDENELEVAMKPPVLLKPGSRPFFTPARYLHDFELPTGFAVAVLHITGTNCSMHMKGDSFTPPAA
ncbi:MAG: hypothetical protein KDD44_08520 [Bdellovibrionales bacterium]|nr:hypothetical protein [Bdellovibrionales bacterium]